MKIRRIAVIFACALMCIGAVQFIAGISHLEAKRAAAKAIHGAKNVAIIRSGMYEGVERYAVLYVNRAETTEKVYVSSAICSKHNYSDGTIIRNTHIIVDHSTDELYFSDNGWKMTLHLPAASNKTSGEKAL